MNTNAKVKSRRKTISKKVRFEVFKRDSFTCQYCGRKSPEVVLHIDHITPVSKGGTNSLMNLVTSCIDCNLGKSANLLSENSVVEKARKQAEMLQERREQIEMLRDWHLELVDERNAQVEAVNNLYSKLTNGKFVITEEYKNKTITKLIAEYGLQMVLESLQAGAESYGEPYRALDKLPGICACRKDPSLNRRVHLLNKMNKKFWNFKRQEASIMIQQGMAVHGESFLDMAEDMYTRLPSRSWYSIKSHFYDLLGDED